MGGGSAIAFTAMVLLVALSGCLGDEPVEEAPYGQVVQEPVPTSTGTTERTSQEPTPSPTPSDTEADGPADQPPEAALTADRTYGTAPLTVRFQFTGHDPEGVDIRWTFDADADGKREAEDTVLPAESSHVYDLGTWEAVFRVTDGNNTTERRVVVEAVAPAPTGPPEPVRIRGTITGAWLQGTGYFPETQNRTFELPRKVDSIKLTFLNGPTAFDLDYEVFAPDGRRVVRLAHFNEPTGELPPPFTGAREPTVTLRGADAALTGTWTIRVMAALAVEGEYVIDITFT